MNFHRFQSKMQSFFPSSIHFYQQTVFVLLRFKAVVLQVNHSHFKLQVNFSCMDFSMISIMAKKTKVVTMRKMFLPKYLLQLTSNYMK